MTKFLLDSGNPNEYREIANLAKQHSTEIWGATTNPTLIAKQLGGKKLTSQEAFNLQKQIVMEILRLVPGAVSAEVYADGKTTASEMVGQGSEIASWHERIVVKLPTTLEGLYARTKLRQLGIIINNTLVFSQEQIFAICLHEKLVMKEGSGTEKKAYPCFISPFVGRLDDSGLNGMDIIKNGVTLRNAFKFSPWILSSSIRTLRHMELTIHYNCDILTAPAKVYLEHFGHDNKSEDELGSSTQTPELIQIPYWKPKDELLRISTLDELFSAISSGRLNINHPLTIKGIQKFSEDWSSIITL